MMNLTLTHGCVANPLDKTSLTKTHTHRFRIISHTDKEFSLGNTFYGSLLDLIRRAEELAQLLLIQDLRTHVEESPEAQNHKRTIVNFYFKREIDCLRLKSIIAPEAIESNPETTLNFDTEEEADYWHSHFINTARLNEMGERVVISRDRNEAPYKHEIYLHTRLSRDKALLLIPYLEFIPQASEIFTPVALLPVPKQAHQTNEPYYLVTQPPSPTR